MSSSIDTVAMTQPSPPPQRRWRTVEQITQTFPFSEAAIRMLIQRSRPYYNHRGDIMPGNGLADAICQPGGKHGKVLIDEIAFALWLEQWAGRRADAA